MASQRIGQTLAHYRILEKIGAGGMGEVYRALDTKLGREVALKFLPSESPGDASLLTRFRREARVIAALKHPNIVTVYSVEEVAGVHFITMELVEGPTLTSLIPDLGFPPPRFFEIAIPLVEAVSCAHERGITHRDLKPDNIMLDGEQRVKILDFGLAKSCGPLGEDVEEAPEGRRTLTEGGAVVGTIAYMSPEQVSGEAVGAPSDIFSLGILFHELLTGARPFAGGYPAEIMYKIANVPPVYGPSLPGELRDLIDRCLRKDPAERFPDAGELVAALRELAGGSVAPPKQEKSPIPSEVAAAIAEGEWEAAYRRLGEIREERPLTPDELVVLGTCAGWIDRFDEGGRIWEKAFAEFAKAGRDGDAARVALLLTALYVEKSAGAIADGWQKRAERLLDRAPESAVHGLLLRRQSAQALQEGDHARALELNRRCADVADRFGDLELQIVALHDQGQILISRGNVDEGRALINESMAAATSGEVDPETLGRLYCRTMMVCRSLADFKSVREWSEATWRWCERYPVAGFRGVCRIYNAESLRHRGLWKEAREAAESAVREFEENGLSGHAGEAYNELGELALLRGDFTEADEAFHGAHERGIDPVPGLPLLRLAEGNAKAARGMIDRALRESSADPLRRARLLAGSLTISSTTGDFDRTEEEAGQLLEIAKEFGCRFYEAHGLLGRGVALAARGDSGTGAPNLHEAWSIFNEQGFPYHAALARVRLAEAYLAGGDDEDAKLQLGAARKTFRELGAGPALAAAERLMETWEKKAE